MAAPLSNFFAYVLDTETTSESTFVQTLFRYRQYYEDARLKEWRTMVDEQLSEISLPIVRSFEGDGRSRREPNDETSSSSTDEEEQAQASTATNKTKKKQKKKLYIYVDPIRRSDRLLQLLYHAYQQNRSFLALYFDVLESLLKSNQEKIRIIALQQIACHLFEQSDDHERVKALIPSSVTAVHSLIERFRSTDAEPELLSDELDVLYPSTGRYLDAHREFRDGLHYLIDGDSLLLSVLHHKSIQFSSNFGHTLHAIYVIERILLTLFHQSNQCNFTVVFFDCHAQLYAHVSPIVKLIRASLIAHLEHNGNRIRSMAIKQFPSWLSDDYSTFIQEERPTFLLYHDFSTLNIEPKNILQADVLERLMIIYLCFGNYHQYTLQCQLFLLNKIYLSTQSVKCFRLEFSRVCPVPVIGRLMTNVEKSTEFTAKSMIVFSSVSNDDVRLTLYLNTMVEMMSEDTLTTDVASLLILHLALLLRLSLLDRHLPRSIPIWQFSEGFIEQCNRFQTRLAENLTASALSAFSWSKIADLFDGRLFQLTLDQLHRRQLSFRLDPLTEELVKDCFLALNLSYEQSLFSTIINRLVESHDLRVPDQAPTLENAPLARPQVIRISNPLIDQYLRAIPQPQEFDWIPPHPQFQNTYPGRYIWTGYKEVGDEISRIEDSNEARKKEKTSHRFRTTNEQKLSNYFTLYGKSLTTRDVRDNQYQIILPTPVQPVAEQSTASAKPNEARKGNAKKTAKNTAKTIREENEKKTMEERIKEESQRLDDLEKELRPLTSAQAIERLDGSLEYFQTSEIRRKVLKGKFRYQRDSLKSLRKKSSLTSAEQSTYELLQIRAFGTLCELVHLEKDVNPFENQMKYMREIVDRSSLTREEWYRFQLEKINSRLPRRQIGTDDPRVKGFSPDPWQVQFLDAVDREESVVIVAPTASGKTYASYYAMEQVKKKSQNGICVYVAPSKALMNQVLGTIQSLFGPIFGMFNADYRMNLKTCRILVTTPESLEMLLLSSEYQPWCKRIQYCIFDEIHCMSGDRGSDVWERILLLINAPMIGLSATVNNGEVLQQWISSIEQQRQVYFRTQYARPVVFISHHERLADLNKYLYSNRQLYPLHPISLMNDKQLIRRRLPGDFSLSPYETCRLHQQLEENPAAARVEPLFEPDWIIERTKCNEQYSKQIRSDFETLIRNGNSPRLNSICQSLNPLATQPIEYPEVKPISTLIGELILTLKEKDLLPCLIFTDSRALSEYLAESVAEYFEKLEAELRRTQYRREIEEIEKRLEMIQANPKKKEKKEKKAAGARDEAHEPDESAEDRRRMEEEDQSSLCLSAYEQKLLNGILEEGTLANLRRSDSDLKDQLTDRAAKRNPELKRFIQRGVGYHHPYLKNPERLAVEGLFRNRFIQVVFSTWTLALGVHMPTRTVAFVKDSMFLDALQYRQSSGRAGRRGFDVQGNIIFIDIPLSKIRHLTISSIPEIRTELATSVTYLMRLLHFYDRSIDKDDALNRSLISLECPFMRQWQMNESIVNQMRYHCLSTFDFLYRLNLLDPQGRLTGLAGLAMHLPNAQPGNLLLTYLINARLFDELQDSDQLINLLAYLFSHRPWLVTRDQPRRNRLFNRRFTLQPLSDQIYQRIRSYNDLVREVYGVYLENLLRYLRSSNQQVEQSLPYSGISFVQASDYEAGTFESQLHHHYSEQSRNPSISPFAGVSGLTHAELLHQLNPSVNAWDIPFDLQLSSRFLPLIDIDSEDQTGARYYMNSYLIDFNREGNERPLFDENQIHPDESYLLNLDFRWILGSISTSLMTILQKDQTSDTQFVRSLHRVFSPLIVHFGQQFSIVYK